MIEDHIQILNLRKYTDPSIMITFEVEANEMFDLYNWEEYKSKVKHFFEIFTCSKKILKEFKTQYTLDLTEK